VISPDSQPTWRAATSADLQAVNDIRDSIHLTLPEGPEVFAEKFRLFPEGCFVFSREALVLGYGLSHPWLLRMIPPLDQFLGALPALPECLFIHDVVVLPQARGHGAASTLVDLLARLARKRGIPYLALVSVYNTDALWARFGFQVVTDSVLSKKLRTYGETARYMILSLSNAISQ
jgi:GNAT superfamily N-acetyltransferase